MPRSAGLGDVVDIGPRTGRSAAWRPARADPGRQRHLRGRSAGRRGRRPAPARARARRGRRPAARGRRGFQRPAAARRVRGCRRPDRRCGGHHRGRAHAADRAAPAGQLSGQRRGHPHLARRRGRSGPLGRAGLEPADGLEPDAMGVPFRRAADMGGARRRGPSGRHRDHRGTLAPHAGAAGALEEAERQGRAGRGPAADRRGQIRAGHARSGAARAGGHRQHARLRSRRHAADHAGISSRRAASLCPDARVCGADHSGQAVSRRGCRRPQSAVRGSARRLPLRRSRRDGACDRAAAARLPARA